MRKKRIPGQSVLAQKAHFQKGGPMELGKTAKTRRIRKQNHQQELNMERGEHDV